jgi:protein arginine N-methyltransferase 2
MDDPAFSTPSVDITTQTIILHSSNHDLPALKPLLRTPGSASVQDPETGTTPLHAAISSCSEPDADIEVAQAVVQELFFSGAIWNDLDKNNETPGCIAWKLGERGRGLYELCVNAGVRAEMLLGLMGGYEELGSVGDEEDEEEQEGEEDVVVENGNGVNGHEHELAVGPTEETELVKEKKDVNSEDYLNSELTFEDDKLLDADANGVMMAWEADIMRKTVDLLIPDLKPGARVLNIGFGMGIVDRMFRDTKPKSHHIIEAHPAVLKKVAEEGSDFGKPWEESAPEGGKYKIHAGKWQDICPKLVEDGEVFDAIYFDTFGEDYSQLKLFFTEYVIALLGPNGRFGFFNGLGADRRVCYDVYCKVAELDLCDAGMDVDWTNVDVPEEGMEKEGEGEWKGVRRRYWTLDKYRLPICTWLG